jgi:hypothetical protein
MNLPRWSRRHCAHPDAYVTLITRGTVLTELCPACGAELAAVRFASREHALAALRDLVGSPPTEPAEAPSAAVQHELSWDDWKPPPVLALHPSGWGRRRAD